MASEKKEVAALGRPFGLGMLYDARRDALIPGMTLWDKKTLQENTVEKSNHSSAFNISASDSIEDKSFLLDVSASLKLSFYSGLIEVGGSAKYLNDEKKFKNQSRVTCQYKATTNFKELLMINILTMDTKQIDVITKSGATHVVTGILYGANAFFVFDSEKLEASKVQNVQGSMEAVIRKIPTFSIEGHAEINLNDEEKDLTNKFSCKFFGDFILKSNPATFEDAVKVYVQLPQLLREKGENAVPLKVWLMPLKNLNTEAAELSKEISNALVERVQDALEDLSKTRIRCNDSLEDRVAENFPVIREELSHFQKLCSHFATNLRQTLVKKLPSIRDGKADESSVEELFEGRDKSPFSHEKLSKWLDDKEREIDIIRSCVDIMEGIKIVRNQTELDREVLAPDVENVLCFVFTSMERGDTYLDRMTTYLKSSTLGSTNEEPWYFSDEIYSNMRNKAKAFRDFAKAQVNNNRLRFLIATISNEKYKGATIYHYKEGILVSEDFTKLDPPDVETITDREDLIWYCTSQYSQLWEDIQRLKSELRKKNRMIEGYIAVAAARSKQISFLRLSGLAVTAARSPTSSVSVMASTFATTLPWLPSLYADVASDRPEGAAAETGGLPSEGLLDVGTPGIFNTAAAADQDITTPPSAGPEVGSGNGPMVPVYSSTPKLSELPWTAVASRGRKGDPDGRQVPPVALSNRFAILMEEALVHPGDAPAVPALAARHATAASPPPAPSNTAPPAAAPSPPSVAGGTAPPAAAAAPSPVAGGTAQAATVAPLSPASSPPVAVVATPVVDADRVATWSAGSTVGRQNKQPGKFSSHRRRLLIEAVNRRSSSSTCLRSSGVQPPVSDHSTSPQHPPVQPAHPQQPPYCPIGSSSITPVITSAILDLDVVNYSQVCNTLTSVTLNKFNHYASCKKAVSTEENINDQQTQSISCSTNFNVLSNSLHVL
ncbi:hypothetical protein ABVT39_010287 [Epinephelus coioides]